jgi:hypothetical protein
LKRLYNEIKPATSILADPDRFISDLFCIYFPIIFFAEEADNNAGRSNVCRSNIKALLAKTQEILKSNEAQSVMSQRLQCNQDQKAAITGLQSTLRFEDRRFA